MAKRGKGLNLKISFNSPVILWFAIICLATLILNVVTVGASNRLLFSVYRSSPLNPLTYLRLFGHVIGHANFSHFMNNMTLILLIGPLLEEKYGSSFMIEVILVTAFVTGVVNIILFPHVALLGASGVVFAFIIMSSFTSISDGSIPLTFILIAAIYIGEQVYQGIFVSDNISQFTHIIGGIVGAVYGYSRCKKRRRR